MFTFINGEKGYNGNDFLQAIDTLDIILKYFNANIPMEQQLKEGISYERLYRSLEDLRYKIKNSEIYTGE